MTHAEKAARLRAWLESVHLDTRAVFDSIPAEKWKQAPAAGGWSAAELSAHLCQTEEAVRQGMERLFATEPKHVPVWKRFHLPPVMAQSRLRRVKTPLKLDTSLLDEKEAMLARFDEVRRASLEVLATGRDRDLSRWRHPHPFMGSFNGFTWFKFLGCHEIRHTKQLREICEGIR